MNAWRSVKPWELISPTNQRLRLRAVHPYRHHTSLSTNSYVTRFILRTCFLHSEYKTTICIPTLEELNKKQTEGASSKTKTKETSSDTFAAEPSNNSQESPQPNRLSLIRWRLKQGRNEERSTEINVSYLGDPDHKAEFWQRISQWQCIYQASLLTGNAPPNHSQQKQPPWQKLPSVMAPPKKRRQNAKSWSHLRTNLSSCLAIPSA